MEEWAMMTLMPEAAISLLVCEISVMPCQSALSVVRKEKEKMEKEKEENAAPSPNAPLPRS
jgi:DsbC/DsbD-like thiol-disulfide interchange protein